MRVSLDRIVIATGNPHKVAELRAILGGLEIEAVALSDLGAYDEPLETGDTFEANASIKALSYAQATGLPCLADDSGVEIDALGGAPGVISSHYCTGGREAGMSRAERDALNNERVLRELEGVSPEGRTARFVCVMALAGVREADTKEGAEPARTRGAGLHPAGLASPNLGHQDAEGAGLNPADPARQRLDNFEPSLHTRRVTPEGLKMREVNTGPHGPLKKRRRRLPHWTRDGGCYFVTFRLLKGELTPEERQIVLDACFHWHGERSLIHLAVIMPDHVHLLITPLPRDGSEWYTLGDTISSAKRHSARQINIRRKASGSIWMDKWHDRLLRPGEFEEKWNYMADNPVRAGLVERSKDYPFLVRGEGMMEQRESAGGGMQVSSGASEASEQRACKAGGMQSRPTRSGDAAPEGTETGGAGLQPAGLAVPNLLALTRGTFEGRIGLPGEVPRGGNGFGYDPIFLVAPGFERTGAELSPEEKNARSHRAAAAELMVEQLRALRQEDR